MRLRNRFGCALCVALHLLLMWSLPAAQAQDALPAETTEPPPPANTPPSTSLAGPVVETVGGGLFVLSAPVLGGVVAVLRGPPWFGCDDGDSACESGRSQQQNSAAVEGAIVGLVIGAIGVALLGHGGYRIRRARAARRAAQLAAFQLHAGPSRAGLAWSYNF